MTDFPPQADMELAGNNPRPMSATAVAGFILSLLGITAVLGLVLAIIGLYRTSRGRLRGRGLAIAAIPISLVTGVVTVIALYVLLLTAGALQAMEQVREALAGTPSDGPAVLRSICTDDLNSEVTDERIIAWIESVQASHGPLMSLGAPEPQRRNTDTKTIQAKVLSEFKKGSEPIIFEFAGYDSGSLKVANLSVGDVRLR